MVKNKKITHKTTHVRMYCDDLNDIKTRFPKTKIADFLHTSIRSNPFLQLEAFLREKRYDESKKARKKR